MFALSLFQALSRAKSHLCRLAAVLAVGFGLTGCMALDGLSDAPPKLSSKMIAEMARKGMTPDSPVLVRIFKQESELEIWKADKTGRYALLKTYPICRWSGQLGPKTTIGDRHAPEGFYDISRGMLNPNSKFYVSFNLGYPNRLESALGYTGEALMVHGACSSSGCYAMTDQGIGEIYAIVDSALSGGQARFQVEAFPFRMTAKAMIAHRGDPNMPFWRTMKEGYDTFEATRRPPKVSVCGGRYVFNRDFPGGEPTDPLAACPPAAGPIAPMAMAKIAVQNQAIDAAMTASVPEATTASAYVDGGMHPSFRALLKRDGANKLAARVSAIKYPISRPEAALADPFEGR